MTQEGCELVVGEAADVLVHDDARGERLVHGLGDPAPQLGLTDQQQEEPVLRVQLVAGEEAQILERSLRRRRPSASEFPRALGPR